MLLPCGVQSDETSGKVSSRELQMVRIHSLQ